MKKPIVLILVALLLCGCSSRVEPAKTGSAVEAVLPVETETPTLQGGFRRADIHFRDMEYIHYQEESFDNFIAPIYRLAEQGGSLAEFSEADTALINEIYYVHTLLTLAKLKHSADLTDSAAAEEYFYVQELYQKLCSKYRRAVFALADSPHKALIDEEYGKGWETEIAIYEDYEQNEFNLFHQEDILVNEYYTLMSQEELDTDAVVNVFLQLVGLRKTIAETYGYDSYADYAYAKIYCRDYTPLDAEIVWHSAKKYFVPLVREYANGTEAAVMPARFDTEFDCSQDAILEAIGQILPDISGELNEAFSYLLKNGLYDISFDTRKAMEGYTVYLHYYEEPFIFNCPYGEFYDYLDTIHEFGHWCNYYFCGSDLLADRDNRDLAELQSQGLEMLFVRYYDRIFGEYADTVRSYVLMSKVCSVIDGAMYDEFLQRVYDEPDLSAARVNEIFAELYESYGYELHEGCEMEWLGVSHNFEDPFYYISYSVSALSALELYNLSLSDWDTIVDKYLKICGSNTEIYSLSNVLKEVDFGNFFAEDICESLASSLKTEIKLLLQ